MQITRRASRKNTTNWDDVVPEKPPEMLWSNGCDTLNLEARNVKDFNNPEAQYDYTVELTLNDVMKILKSVVGEGGERPELQTKLKQNVDAIAGLLACACGQKMVPIQQSKTS